jgi:hypothetical protein
VAIPSVSQRRAKTAASARPTLERERRRTGLALPHCDARGAFRRQVVAAWAGHDRAVGGDLAYRRIARAALVLSTKSARASHGEISPRGRLSAHLNGGIRVVHGDVVLSKDDRRE